MTDESRPASGPRRPSRLFLALLAAIGALVFFCSGAAVLGYKPARIRGAINRVRDGEAAGFFGVATESMSICLEAACGGDDEAAMELVVDHPELLCRNPTGEQSVTPLPPTIAFLAASGNRRLFCRVLDRRDDQQALRALWFVAESNGEIESLMGKGTPYYGPPEDVVGLAARLRVRSRAGDPQVSGVAKAILEYVEQRFGKELAQRQERARAQATDAVAWVESATDAEGLKMACDLATSHLHRLQRRWACTPIQEHLEACLAKVEAREKKIPEKLPECQQKCVEP